MPRRVACLLLFAILAGEAATVAAEPIIKPKKYHGPIPRSSFALRVGFIGGPENTEMIEALDKDIQSPFEAFSEDFGTGLTVDGTYTYKVHPQFAVRANVSASFLRTTGTGTFVPDAAGLPDSVLATQLDYTRDFDVDLFVGEVSALYYFSDAAIQEFQPYVGGGFSVGVPHAKFKETRIDHDNRTLFQEIDRDRWSFEPGIHGFAGASYFITNLWAVNAESRFQMLQSKFPIDVIDREAGRLREVDVIVHYDAFMLSIGVARAF
jgi:opacity protein-like surface antigen